MTQRDQALESLSAEFPDVPARVIVSVFLGYLSRCDTLTAAVEASRIRILDACQV